MPVGELSDPRRAGTPVQGTEREVLEAFLDHHRTTLLLKCEGLSPEQLRARPIPSSLLSLHGLVRHLAEVERNWFQRVVAGRSEIPDLYGEDDAEFLGLETADFETDLAVWQAECASSRAAAAAHDLDHTGMRGGEPHSLRWVYAHMIEEYARHNGHADLLRELIDGAVGE